MNPRRIFVLGAGFSRPANLPLGTDLFQAVQEQVAFLSDSAQHVFKKDFERYVRYRKLCDGDPLPEEVNFEEFLSFLDIEHYLSLRGNEEWSPEGNQTQMLVKGLIGKVIHEKTPTPALVPNLYLEFAERLVPGDFILSFNYDILLERALERINKPYRLFAERSYDDPRNEVILLKLHGSVDWFDRRTHELDEKYSPTNSPGPLSNRVFRYPQYYGIEPILDANQPIDNPLGAIYRIRQVDEFYSGFYQDPLVAPWILSPSYSKILYAPTLRELWYGLSYVGSTHVGFGVIGFSLPEHDEYLRQVIYEMVRLYQDAWWDDEIIPGVKKGKVKLIDYRQTQEEVEKFRRRYRFIDPERAEEYFGGFNGEALDFLFTSR